MVELCHFYGENCSAHKLSILKLVISTNRIFVCIEYTKSTGCIWPLIVEDGQIIYYAERRVYESSDISNTNKSWKCCRFLASKLIFGGLVSIHL